jgi:hypothetical protein
MNVPSRNARSGFQDCSDTLRVLKLRPSLVDTYREVSINFGPL